MGITHPVFKPVVSRPAPVVFGAKKPANAPQPEKPVPPQGEMSRWQQLMYESGRPKRAMKLNLEYGLRVVASKLFARQYRKTIDRFDQLFPTSSQMSPQYIQALMEVAQFFAAEREIEINTESGRIQELAASDEACIFLMNHDHQMEDPSFLGLFTLLLYEEYLNQGKGSTCPHPKIILNQDILNTMTDPKLRRVYERLGAVGVDARVGNEARDTFGAMLRDGMAWLGLRKPAAVARRDNSRVMLPLIKGLQEDRNHIFLFPEGRLAWVSQSMDGWMTEVTGRLEGVLLTLKESPPETEAFRTLTQEVGTLHQQLRGQYQAVRDQAKEIQADPQVIEAHLEASQKTLEAIHQALKAWETHRPSDRRTLRKLIRQQSGYAKLIRQMATRDIHLKHRFQTGVCSMIRSVSKRKERVKVVPLGFAFNEHSRIHPLGSIYVGEPVYFKRDAEGKMQVSPGNITAETYPKYFAQFPPGAPYRTMKECEQGAESPLQQTMGAYLYHNLRICKEAAQQILPAAPASEETLRVIGETGDSSQQAPESKPAKGWWGWWRKTPDSTPKDPPPPEPS